MTKPFTSSKTGIIVLTTLLIFMYSCKKDVTSDNSIAVFSAAKASSGGKPGSLKEVPLIVSFAPVQDDGTTCLMTSDGADYVHGSQNVTAKIDVYGNFIFNTQLSSKVSVQRHLNYDFSSPTDGPALTELHVNGSKNSVFNMIGSNYSCTAHTPLQNLPLNTPESVGIGGGFSGDDGNDYTVSFHRSAEDTQNTPTSFAVVTRTKEISKGDAVDEWTIVSKGSSCSNNENVGSLKQPTRTSPVHIGYYNLPFKITLTAQ